MLIIRLVGLHQFERNTEGKSVGQDFLIFGYKKIGEEWVTANVVIQHFLESNQVIDENIVCCLEGHCVGNIFGLGRGRIEETAAVTLRDQK